MSHASLQEESQYIDQLVNGSVYYLYAMYK